MATFTTPLKDRDPAAAALKLSRDEALAMEQAGFRFSIFDPANDDYRMSRPYRMLLNLTRGTVTLEQA